MLYNTLNNPFIPLFIVMREFVGFGIPASILCWISFLDYHSFLICPVPPVICPHVPQYYTFVLFLIQEIMVFDYWNEICV